MDDALDEGDECDEEHIRNRSVMVEALSRHKLTDQYILTHNEMHGLVGFAREVIGLAVNLTDDGELEVEGYLDTDMIKHVEKILQNHGFESLVQPGELEPDAEDEDEDEND